VHYVSGGDVLVTFSGPVVYTDWTPEWLELEDTGSWIEAETVDQAGPNALLFNSPDFPTAVGTPWRLTSHPAPVAAPYSGVTV
jgi:hypothetical protein